MDHVAIMKKEWKLTEKILSGEKTVETRWYLHKVKPWNCIKRGEVIYFKDTGGVINMRACVKKVEQFADLNDLKIQELLEKYSEKDLGTKDIKDEIKQYIKGKRYAIIIHLCNPEHIEPFNIDKKGFGAMSAWMCIDDINMIKI